MPNITTNHAITYTNHWEVYVKLGKWLKQERHFGGNLTLHQTRKNRWGLGTIRSCLFEKLLRWQPLTRPLWAQSMGCDGIREKVKDNSHYTSHIIFSRAPESTVIESVAAVVRTKDGKRFHIRF